MSNAKVIYRKNVPGVGGFTKRGTIVIDRRVPKKYRKPIILHERVEFLLMRKCGWKYPEAHKRADQFEKALIFKGRKKKQWKPYMAAIRRINRPATKVKRRHKNRRKSLRKFR